MGMMLKPRCNRPSGWGKGLLDQKKKHWWVGQKSRCCWLCFWLESIVPSWICTTWSDGEQTVVLEICSAFEGCCAQEEAWTVGKADLDIAPRQCAGSRVAPHPQLSGITPDIRCAPSTLFSGLSPSRLFPVSQT